MIIDVFVVLVLFFLFGFLFCFSPAFLLRFCCIQIAHLHVIEVSTFTAGKDLGLKVLTFESLHLGVHTNICFPRIRGRKISSLDKLLYKPVPVWPFRTVVAN